MSSTAETLPETAAARPRVLCVTLNSDRPETESFIGLRARGVDLHVMCQPDATHLGRLEDAGVPVTPLRFKGRRDKTAIAAIRRKLDDGAYDILHLYHNKPVLNGLVAARGLPVKIVVYRGIVGNVSFFDPTSWQRYLNPRIDRIICVCNAARDFFHQMHFLWMRFPRDKAVRIYKGHDLAWYDAKPADLTDFGIPTDAYVVGCVANWRPRKGIEVLVDACGRLPDDIPVHLVLVGDMRSPSLDKAVAASPIGARVHRVGFRDDAPALAAAFDVGVLPALKREGLPRSVIETMAYGVAPVVTDSGGSPELVVDGESGLVVRSGDPIDLARALERLYREPALRVAMGRAARQRIAAHFRIETTIEETLALYRTLIAAG